MLKKITYAILPLASNILFTMVFKIQKTKVGKEATAPLSGAAPQAPCYLDQNRADFFWILNTLPLGRISLANR